MCVELRASLKLFVHADPYYYCYCYCAISCVFFVLVFSLAGTWINCHYILGTSLGFGSHMMTLKVMS